MNFFIYAAMSLFVFCAAMNLLFFCLRPLKYAIKQSQNKIKPLQQKIIFKLLFNVQDSEIFGHAFTFKRRR